MAVVAGNVAVFRRVERQRPSGERILQTVLLVPLAGSPENVSRLPLVSLQCTVYWLLQPS
jgi:hypothetical protein